LFGIGVVTPVILINTLAFIFFWAFIFIQFRSTLYPEQDLSVIKFSFFIVTLFIFSFAIFNKFGLVYDFFTISK
jgi:hypothetical protein